MGAPVQLKEGAASPHNLNLSLLSHPSGGAQNALGHSTGAADKDQAWSGGRPQIPEGYDAVLVCAQGPICSVGIRGHLGVSGWAQGRPPCQAPTLVSGPHTQPSGAQGQSRLFSPASLSHG